MSAKAMVAMDHLEKLRSSGDATAKHAANFHLDSLNIARTRRAGELMANECSRRLDLSS